MIEPRELQRWQRHMDTLIQRAGEDDPDTFAALVRLLDATRARLPEAAAQLQRPIQLADKRTVRGYSWADIAQALGVSRNAAFKRFHTRPADRDGAA